MEQEYKRHFYITLKFRELNGGLEDISLEKLESYDVAEMYMKEFYKYFLQGSSSFVTQKEFEPILISNDTRLNLKYRNVFSSPEFKKYCIEYKPGLSTTFEHFQKIATGHYNSAKTVFIVEDDVDEDSGGSEEWVYFNGWKTSFDMIQNRIITNGVDYSEEGLGGVYLSDFHWDWWGSLNISWKKFFADVIYGDVFGGIPTYSGLVDLLNVEKLTYYSEHQEYLNSIAPLSQFQLLKELRMKSNRIQDITPLINIRTLEVLDLENNLIEFMESLGNLPNLYDVNLSRNKIKNVPELPALKKLIMNSNLITDLHGISKSRQIEHLELDYNSILDLGSIRMLKNLKYLSLRNNKITSVESFSL